jgi:hypothetical protein
MARRRRQSNPYLQSAAAVDKALVDGVGGLAFTAQSPPGVGRLIRIPFYLTTGVANRITSLQTNQAVGPGAGSFINNLAAGAANQTVPVCAIDFAGLAAAGATGTAIMSTPQISWATLRIVAFEIQRQDATLNPASAGEVCVSDLQIGGGANLFVHEDMAPSGIYLSGSSSFAGLRDYPILKSPNTASVSVQGLGAPASARITFSASLVCEILVDDNYGAHIPGPYARPGALVRQGGSFV